MVAHWLSLKNWLQRLYDKTSTFKPDKLAALALSYSLIIVFVDSILVFNSPFDKDLAPSMLIQPPISAKTQPENSPLTSTLAPP